jgi:gas vesicle protein
MGEDIAPPQNPPTVPTPSTPTGGQDQSSTTEVAKDQAGQVADTAKQAGTQVAGTVKEQAGQVTAEAGKQAKQLLSQAQSEVTEQAAATQQRVAEGLHALADELTGMTKNSDQDGPATDLVRQAADKAHQAAGWLADRDPGSLLNEVRSFARRKPGTYLALALGAGVLAGRLTRGLTAPTDDAPAGSAASNGLASTRTTFPTQFDGSEPLTDPFAGAPITTVTGYETGADPVPPAVPSTLDSLGNAGNTNTGTLPGPRTAP